jgi:reverse gyrase
VQEAVLSGEVKLRKPGQIFQNGVGVNQGKPFRNRNRSYAAVNRIAMFPVPTTGNFSSLNREWRNPVAFKDSFNQSAPTDAGKTTNQMTQLLCPFYRSKPAFRFSV